MTSHDEFVKKLPFPVVPLNIPGAYACPPPPDAFDLETASPAELVRHGWLWRRPKPGDPPIVAAAWKALTSRRWHAKDCIVPHLEPLQRQPRLSARDRIMKPPVRHDHGHGSGPTTNLQNQVAGCVLVGQFFAVFAQWAVPTVSQPNEPQGTNQEFPGWWSDSWIGIDGVFGGSFLVAGVEQIVSSSGIPTYFTWFQWSAPPAPGNPSYVGKMGIPLSVGAGQTVMVGVQYTGSPTPTAGLITFANVTTGQFIPPMPLAPPSTAVLSGNDIGWIMDDPGGGYPGLALPKFTPVHFTNAAGCSAGGIASPNDILSNPQAGQLLGIQNGNTVMAVAQVGQFIVNIEYTGM